jgi:RNA polymerase-binding transcription factor DksA
MADPADIAADTVEACQADAERRARGKSGPEHDSRFDGLHCVEEDCGVEIPRERLNALKVRCVDCQARLEKRRRMEPYNRKA